ncbi:MAG TPA: phosphatidate cytidylyltransferase [Desulfomicrobium sp.]|nr:phosphatidate cytidylyltransferase [Desulfomicrobium sp.]
MIAFHALPPSRLFMLSTLAVLALVTLGVALKEAHRSGQERQRSEVLVRTRTWWLIVLPLFGVLSVSRGAAISFFCIVSYLAFKEYLTFIPTRRADHRVLFWAYLAIPIQYYFAYISWYGMFIIFIPVYCFLLLPVRMLLRGDTQGFLKAVGTLHWGLMTTVFSLSHAAFLLTLHGAEEGGDYGVSLVLLLVILTEANDIAQFCWGKGFGHAKVVPSVSPNKTWAGLIGGVATTALLAGLAGPYLTPMAVSQALLAGVLIGISGFFGDICVSAIKRDIGIKDTGNMLPGHGGILDRVDSLTFTAPIFFHFIYYTYH